jgi:hypothetical protein
MHEFENFEVRQVGALIAGLLQAILDHARITRFVDEQMRVSLQGYATVWLPVHPD